jgi:hypothetical protein
MKKFISLGLIIVCGITLSACGSNSNSSSSDTSSSSNVKAVKNATNTESSSASSAQVTSNYLAADATFGDFVDQATDGTDITITNKKEYSSSFSDNSWAGVNLTIDKVAIYKTSDIAAYSGDTYNGFIAVHYNVDNVQQDVSIYPTQGKVVTSYGEQIDDGGVALSLDSWDGDMMAGAKKDGWGIYPTKQLADPESVTNLRIQIDSSYETDNYDDDNAYHTYDVSLQLQ